MTTLSPRQFGQSKAAPRKHTVIPPRTMTTDITDARGRVASAGAEIPSWLQRSHNQPGRPGL